MADVTKRKLPTADGAAAVDTLVPPTKLARTRLGDHVARLGDDVVAAMPVGSNYIEIDGKSCTHEVCWPIGVEGSKAPPPQRKGPPAREYPFKIDPFQQTAINALEAGRRLAW